MNGGRLIVEIKDLTGTGADHAGLERLSLRLDAGETLVLLGEADSGKDAVLGLLGGLADHRSEFTGTVRFGEGEARQAARRPQPTIRVAYLPAASTAPLVAHVAASQQLARIVARKLGCPRGAAREEIRTVLARMTGAPAADFLDRSAAMLDPVTLSWGLLAAALAQTPEFLVCDNSFADLSPAAARALTRALLVEKARSNFAILYAARGPLAIARLGGRAMVIRKGRVVEEGDAAHLMSGQTHAYTRAMFKALPRLDAAPRLRSIARGEPLLQVQGLNLQREGKIRARDAISFELRRGAALALIGEEGSGRRALANAILGLDRRPGRVLFDAVDINLLSQTMAARLRRRVAFVTGRDDALDPRMTLWDTIDEPLRAHLRLSRELVAGYRDSALKRVGLASQDGRRTVATLSPFDKRRLQVARAIVAAPLLVVVDEPLRGLDGIAQTTMRDLLSELRIEQQAAFLIVTADFSVAQALADDAMIFAGGRMVERGPIRDLLRDPKDDATRALIEAATVPLPPEI